MSPSNDSGFGAGAPPCQGPDRSLRRPARLTFPRGATDCHAHILGPSARYPYAQERIYTPPDCTLGDYTDLLNSLGIDRAVLVQPSVYGTDNRAMLDALRKEPQRFRGVAVVSDDISEQELHTMHGLGVRGIRCNVVDVANKASGLPMAYLKKLCKKIAPLNWHLELLAHVNDYPDLEREIEALPVDVVFGHFGYMHASKGIENPGFEGLLALLEKKRAWVKMTGPYRISSESAPPYDDMAVFAREVIKANSDQLIWGSDWPHVMVKTAMPNDADLADLLVGWVPDAHLREKILVSNAARLYQFA